MPNVSTAAEWQAEAKRIRAVVLEKVFFCGQAAKWRDAQTKVEWLETIPGGPGYRIKKLRYEALPGMWIPALLYEPENLSGKVPVAINVNGHERPRGKALPYKQLRCINLAKRGILALNPEWLHMGQLHTPGFNHFKLNQLDVEMPAANEDFHSLALALSKQLPRNPELPKDRAKTEMADPRAFYGVLDSHFEPLR